MFSQLGETIVGGGFKYFVIVTPIFGEDSHFDQYVSNGLKSPTRILVI